MFIRAALHARDACYFEDRIDGYWTVSGNQIYLTDQFDQNFPYIGTVSNRTITISGFNSGSGYDEVYSK